MSERPELTLDIGAPVFADHYWLREELADFCRAHGLSDSGKKEELTARISAMLTGTLEPPVSPRAARKTMPLTFTRDTVVGQGWRCSEALRAFISAEIGKPFRFDRFMREQIASGGVSLGDLIDAWRKQEGRRHEIEPQFEYNRFTRIYRTHYPKATHQEVVNAWKRYRSMPSSQRPSVEQMRQ